MNPLNSIMMLKQAWDTFTSNHPKFPMFINAVRTQNIIRKDSVIEISITTPEGQNYTTNVKLTDSDLLLFETLKNQAMQNR